MGVNTLSVFCASIIIHLDAFKTLLYFYVSYFLPCYVGDLCPRLRRQLIQTSLQKFHKVKFCTCVCIIYVRAKMHALASACV